jgi:hypothetical protein
LYKFIDFVILFHSFRLIGIDQLNKVEKIPNALIIKMVQTNRRNKINSILVAEIIGGVVCFLAAIFILSSLKKLDNWYLLDCGIVSISGLVILLIVSIGWVRKMLSIKGSSFFSLSFCLGAVLMLAVLPVMGKLIGGADLFKTTRLWFIYAIGFPYFYYFARRVGNCHRKAALG